MAIMKKSAASGANSSAALGATAGAISGPISGAILGSDSGRTVLVTGVTGTVGSEVVRALLDARAGGDGVMVRVLTRAPERVPRRLARGLDIVRGDLRDAASVDRALEGVDAALYVSPHEPDEEELARSFVAACERHATRIVYVGVHVDGPNRFVRMLKRAAYAVLFPHYRPKFRISERVRQSQARPVILMPSNFFQNDEIVRDLIESGTYPLPLRGVNRVDVRDLGDVAARALLDPGIAEGAYPVVGPVSLSGEESAAVWSKVLGRAIHHDDDDARFAERMRARVSGKKLADMIASYRLLRKFELPTKQEELAATTALLGRPPRSYEEYVRDLTGTDERSTPSRVEAAQRAS